MTFLMFLLARKSLFSPRLLTRYAHLVLILYKDGEQLVVQVEEPSPAMAEYVSCR